MAGKEHLYQATLVWTGAAAGPATDYKSYSREYRVEIAGKPTLAGSADPAYLGDAKLHNPEDLLLAALSACHMLTYLALCTRDKISVTAYRDEASGVLAVKDGKMRFTSVVLRPQVTIAGTDADKLERAKALHAQAHAGCFVANSVNFPVEHEATVTVA
jgi:organic hydroperoxide reductase OsmC/OhrA